MQPIYKRLPGGRSEAGGNALKINDYNDLKLSENEINCDVHRDAVGGMWDELGKLQFDFMIGQGLIPGMRLVDVGCGCLRGGIYFIRYLDAGNYYGIDVNQTLLDAGYNTELARYGLQNKLPRPNLLQDAHFRFSLFGTTFDYAIAQSVFTHLPLNHIRLCLLELAKCMKEGGRFFATFFECPEGHPIEQEITHQPGGVVTHTDQDPYHYKVRDFLWCIDGLPWEMNHIGDWHHPRAQRMLCFTKTR